MVLANPPFPPGFQPVYVPSLKPGLTIMLPDGTVHCVCVTVDVVLSVVVDTTLVEATTSWVIVAVSIFN